MHYLNCNIQKLNIPYGTFKKSRWTLYLFYLIYSLYFIKMQTRWRCGSFRSIYTYISQCSKMPTFHDSFLLVFPREWISVFTNEINSRRLLSFAHCEIYIPLQWYEWIFDRTCVTALASDIACVNIRKMRIVCAIYIASTICGLSWILPAH